MNLTRMFVQAKYPICYIQYVDLATVPASVHMTNWPSRSSCESE